MKKNVEKPLTKRSLVEKQLFIDAARAMNKPAVCGNNTFDALEAYAGEKGKKFTFAFLASIKGDEKIKGVGVVGFKLIARIQKATASLK